jgi:FkbM family methyltransferase
MTFVSFAQNYEDVILWRALGHLKSGFYVDVGAYSPDEHSVTRAFYERGWHGINIEPNPFRVAELKAKRFRDLNLAVAASDSNRTVQLHLVEDTGLTTAEADIASRHFESGWDVTLIDVPARTLSSILEENLPFGESIHFLKIDVEGHEAAVLRGINLALYRPWIIVVEATAPMSQVETSAEWEPLIESANYLCVYWDGLNRYYLADEHLDLKSAFSAPPNVFDAFIRSSEAEAVALSQRLADERQALQGQADAETRRAEQAGERADALEHQYLTTRLALDRVSSNLNYITHRALWESVLFRPSGKPKRALRRLLFHKSGKPRRAFQNLILKKDGMPHKPFRMWMMGPDYQDLSSAVRFYAHGSSEISQMPESGPSPRARSLLEDLQRRIAKGGS